MSQNQTSEMEKSNSFYDNISKETVKSFTQDSSYVSIAQ